jgi:Cu/Ag efflux pump CusA
MKQKEITDKNNVRWQCVEAFSLASSKETKKAAAQAGQEQDSVEVVCTPNGGEQTVRLQLQHGWTDSMTEQQLLDEIEKQKSAS